RAPRAGQGEPGGCEAGRPLTARRALRCARPGACPRRRPGALHPGAPHRRGGAAPDAPARRDVLVRTVLPVTARTAREPRHRRTPDVVEWSWRVRDDELDMRLDDLKAKYQWEFADRLFEAGVAPMGEPQWSIRVRPRLFRGEV